MVAIWVSRFLGFHVLFQGSKRYFESKQQSGGLVKQLNNGSRWQHGAHLCKVTDLHENDLIPHAVRVLWLHLEAFKIKPNITQLWESFPNGLSIDAVGNWTKNGTCRGHIAQRNRIYVLIINYMHAFSFGWYAFYEAKCQVSRSLYCWQAMSSTEGGRSGMKQFYKLGKGKDGRDLIQHYQKMMALKYSVQS